VGKPGKLRAQFQRTLRRDLWLTLGPALLLVALAFAATFLFVKPAPPRSLTLATPGDEGGSRYFARRYQQILARDGVTVTLRPSAGSVSNIQLLDDARSDVDVAFVQSGTAGMEKADGLISLGSLTYTPLWVFHRGEHVEDLRGLAGKRIGVGKPESGTHALALTLLAANGVTANRASLLPLGREDAVKALQEGSLDAAFLVSPADAPILKKLATTPGIRLLSFSRADAYVRRYPYLVKRVLPRGIFDLGKDVPSADVILIAPTANLVARSTLHPALAYLLMRAASEVHGGAGLLADAGEFPAPLEAGVRLSREAKRYYEAGVPLLQRYLPFWAASLVDRLWVMLVPIIAVVVPLGRAVPAAYRWRIRSRVFKWYAQLKEIELQLDEEPDRAQLQDMLRRLEEAERAVNQIPTPLAYAENLYIFREHIDIVRRRLVRRLAGIPESTDPLAS